MVADVLAALGAVAGLDEVIVVTAEPIAPRAAEQAGAAGRRTTRTRPASRAAAARGDRRGACERGAERALLVPGDCPALDPDEVDALLARTPGDRRS